MPLLGVEVVVVACGLRGLARSFVEVGRRAVERSRASDRTGVHAHVIKRSSKRSLL